MYGFKFLDAGNHFKIFTYLFLNIFRRKTFQQFYKHFLRRKKRLCMVLNFYTLVIYLILLTFKLLIPHLLRNVVVACRKSFICRGWLNPVTSAGRGQCKVGVSYLGTWRCGCSCGELVGISSGSWLTNKDVSLIMRGRLYSSCVGSSMLHGRNENVVASKDENGQALS